MWYLIFTTTSTREIQLCTRPATQLTRSPPLPANRIPQSIAHALNYNWKGFITAIVRVLHLSAFFFLSFFFFSICPILWLVFDWQVLWNRQGIKRLSLCFTSQRTDDTREVGLQLLFLTSVVHPQRKLPRELYRSPLRPHPINRGICMKINTVIRSSNSVWIFYPVMSCSIRTRYTQNKTKTKKN